MKTCVQAKIVGRVQGVGFRPTVYRYATELGLTGFVRNDARGVVLEIEGEEQSIVNFFEQLRQTPPSQAVISSVDQQVAPLKGYAHFAVLESMTGGPVAVHIAPDLATCDDCLRELLDPQDRRFGYPFINCTNCGPRFTIISDLPYDRAATSMAGFTMCPTCDREYHDPADRRFHAQPNGCEKCGPQLQILEGEPLRTGSPGSSPSKGNAIGRAIDLLRAGQIVAVKSLGGFHLACTLAASAKLRDRKQRPHKPLAVMFRDIETVRQHCSVSEAEEAELLSVARPIVILKVTGAARLLAGISPDFPTIGAFLPYTPIHHLLLQHFTSLVMTSGNLVDEPIASIASELPASIADAVLSHDRAIAHKCDDSVVRIVNGQRQLFRRARGFAPNAIRFAGHSVPILAVGGELKSTFCLARDGWAFLSQHLGDLKEYRTNEYFEHEISEWQRLMRIAPVAVAHDLHPEYRSTKFARWLSAQVPKGLNPQVHKHLGTPALIGVQHHHAHIVSVMAEHNLQGEMIGVALDGTGYGPDGTIWGGEFLVATRAEFERLAHFKQYRLPGGEKAIQEPWRMAVSVLCLEGETPGEPFGCGSPGGSPSKEQFEAVRHMVANGFNSPLTSSAGRLFDAVAALLGLCSVATYEAQAAIRLEAIADGSVTGHYPFEFRDGILDFGPTIRAIVEDRQAVGIISARFHNTVVAGIGRTCEWMRAQRGLHRVALSGGVFQNEWILTRTLTGLRRAGFEVFTNTQVPPNDGGLAFGQVAVAAARLEGKPPGEPLRIGPDGAAPSKWGCD